MPLDDHIHDVELKDRLKLRVPGKKLASSPVNDLCRGTKMNK